jgi:hypothetical protein
MRTEQRERTNPVWDRIARYRPRRYALPLIAAV